MPLPKQWPNGALDDFTKVLRPKKVVVTTIKGVSDDFKEWSPLTRSLPRLSPEAIQLKTARCLSHFLTAFKEVITLFKGLLSVPNSCPFETV
jgi:hypothetical protein